VAKGNAGRVIAFFRGFLQEAAAGRHGQPGQAAGGKPIYTRAQITQMASLRRKGVYSDAEWAHGRLNLSLLVEKGASSVLWTPTAFQ
jgi:hypothetical protein